MKKTVILILLVLTLFLTFTENTLATTIIYFGRDFGGQVTTYNNSRELINNTLGFSYVEGLKLCAEMVFGPGNDLGEIKVGFPILDNNEGLIYVTAGFLNFKIPNSEADGGMLGFDFVSIITDRVYFEWDLQYSLLQASYKETTTIPPVTNNPLGWTSVKFKVQWLLSDHLALAFDYHYMNLNINYSEDFRNVSLPSLSLLYRL
jgi:hypothetical protein